MATIQEIFALFDTLKAEKEALDTAQVVSHDAVANVTTVHDTEQAKIDAATASFTIAVNEAQAQADAAVADTNTKSEAVDDTIDSIEAALESLRNTPKPTP